jgi:hypothetical protein
MRSNILKSFAIALPFVFAIALTSCQKTFLQVPPGGNATVDSVFSNSTNAYEAISAAYFACLRQGLNWSSYWAPWTDEQLAGSEAFWNVGTSSNSYTAVLGGGLTATSGNEDYGSNNNGYDDNFLCIRKAYLVKENIDMVSDMSASDKAIAKAEMQALVAYRYTQMFIMYGGVPILSKSFPLSSANALPSLAVPRAPLQAVLDSIVSWCDQSASVLPSQWAANYLGRMTKAAALAIKAKALMYAARPLFNTGTPYLNLGTNNNLICLGSANPALWQTALAASEAVIKEAEGSGGLHIINTGYPLDDYGNATSTPSNPEVILAFKQETGGGGGGGPYNIWCISWYAANYQSTGSVLSSSMLSNYYKADGTEQTWPALGQVAPFTQYTANFNQMEPRFLADWDGYEMYSANNPGDYNWSMLSGHFKDVNHYGVGQPTKFYYHAGSRTWFDFPLFRLAAYYLSSAEAYNETGDPGNALKRLNVVHERAGLPAITVTDPTQLRQIIHREWATEFYREKYRLHDLKHWKDPNIGNGIIGGPIRFFTYNNGGDALQTGNTNYGNSIKYTGYWDAREYINPFPQSEINLGYLIQNPGY